MRVARHTFFSPTVIAALGVVMSSLMGGCPGPGAGGPGPAGDVADNQNGSGNNPPRGDATQNQPPEATSLQVRTARNVSACVQLSAGDPEGSALTFALATEPQHGELSGALPELIYTPDPDYVGPDSFTYVASDGRLQSDAATVTVDVRAARIADGGPIANGETVNGVVDSDADPDAWTLSAAPGQIIRVRCTRTSGQWTPAVYLFPPGGGNHLTSTTAGGAASAVLDYPLETAGDYSIVVEDAAGAGSGEYALSVINLTEPPTPLNGDDGGLIQSSQTRSGFVGLQGETDAYSFAGVAGQTVRIRVTKTDCSAWTPAITLYPAGSDAFTFTTSGGDSWGQLDHVLETSGNYTILVEDYFGADVGAYNLALLNLDAELTNPQDPDGGPIFAGLPRTGRIDLPGDIDAFVFNGTAGQRIRVRVTRSPAADWTPATWLFAPAAGGFVTSVTAGPDPTAELNYQLPTTGEITIVVEDYAGPGVGDYTVAVEQF